MALRAKLVLPTRDATWVSETEIPIAPFPGLGIRLDVYFLLNVKSVVIGDPGFDVTCIVEIEDANESEITEKQLEAFGFAVGNYP
jgi:5,10-methenyltetrahydromethanopterin hydrogenase